MPTSPAELLFGHWPTLEKVERGKKSVAWHGMAWRGGSRDV